MPQVSIELHDAGPPSTELPKTELSSRKSLSDRLRHLRGLPLPVLPIVVLLAYVAAVLYSEKIKVGGGLGWDGVVYGRWVYDLELALKNGINNYYIQRIFPSALLHFALRALDLPRTNPQIIQAFEVGNVLVVAASAFSYDVIARHLRVSDRARWLGAIAVFGNFALLKYSAFYPVLTDVWAFALGTLQVQLFLTRRVYWLSVVTVVGAFTWPTLLPLGACLLLFSAAPQRREHAPAPAPAHLNDVIAGLLVAAWLWQCYSRMRPGYTLDNGTGVIDERFLALSVLVAGAYTFWSVRQLLDDRQLFQPLAYLRSLSLRSVLLTIAVFATVALTRSQLTKSNANAGLEATLNELVFSTLKEPGLFALAHALVWGPILLIVMLRWRRVVAAIHDAGIGATLVALIGVLLSLHSESRKLANLVPFFYCLALPCLDRLALSRKALLALCVASIGFSRVWVEFDPRMRSPLHRFPSQELYMVIGPWMTPRTYAVQGAIVLVVGLVLFWWLRTTDSAEAPAGDAAVLAPPGEARPAE
ncbi:MAG: hypothetical protein RL685_5619 [Pseudomonadota bacterium]|jgi:hypothetical protein